MSHKPYKKLKKKIKKVIKKPIKDLAEAITGQSWEELKHGDGAVAKLKKQKKQIKRALKGKKSHHHHKKHHHHDRPGEKPSGNDYSAPPVNMNSLKSVKKAMKEPWSALVGGVVKGEVSPELIDTFEKLNRRFDALKDPPWDKLMPEYMRESERFLRALREGDLVAAKKFIKPLSAHKSQCHDQYKK